MASYVQLPNEHYKAKFELKEKIQHVRILLKVINGRGYILIEPLVFNKIWMGKNKRKDHPGGGNGVETIHTYFSKEQF